MYKAFIKNLLAEGKIAEALKLMRNLTETQNKYFSDPLIGLSSQFNRNREDRNRGRGENSDFNITNNRIVDALESILDSEFEEDTIPSYLWSSLTSNLIQKEVKKEVEVLKSNHNFFGFNMKNPNNLRTWMNLPYEPNSQAEFDELEQFTTFILSYLNEQIEDKFEFEHLTFHVRVAEENFMRRKYPYSAMELKKKLATVEEVVIQLLELEIQELPIETQINNLAECGIDTFVIECVSTIECVSMIDLIFKNSSEDSKLDFLNFYKAQKLNYDTLSEGKVSVVQNKLFRDFKNTIITKLKAIF